MTIVAHIYPFAIGVDTHAQSHTVAVVAADGELVGQAQFPASSAGINRAITWVARRTGGDLDALWAIEGIGTYGSQIARMATQAGYLLVEAPRVSPGKRRGVGKSDPLDSRAIAETALAQDQARLRHPRDDNGTRAALRILVTARRQLSHERTVNINALTALLRSTNLGVDARKPLTTIQIDEISHWRANQDDTALHIAKSRGDPSGQTNHPTRQGTQSQPCQHHPTDQDKPSSTTA